MNESLIEADESYVEGWSNWSHLYYPSDFEVKTILASMSDLATHSILEIGCGDGRVTERLAQIASDVTAIDIDNKLIEGLSKKQSSVKYQCMSGLGLDFENESFDTVLYFWSLHQMNPMLETIKEAHRCLKKGGHLIVFGLTEKGEYDEVVEAFGEDPGHHVQSYEEHIQSVREIFGSIKQENRIGNDGEYGFKFDTKEEAKKNWLWSLSNWHGVKIDSALEDKLSHVLDRYKRDDHYFLAINGVYLIAQK